MEKKLFNENDIDAVFRRADFGMRGSHKDELQRQLFQESESELSEDELFEAAGGLKKQGGRRGYRIRDLYDGFFPL